MGRLRTLSPTVARLPPRLALQPNSERERSQHRDRSAPWRRWYKTARWQKLRLAIFVRDLFTCRICKRFETNTSLLVCDHVERHMGNEHRFWAGPFQTLCKSCHDKAKQRAEQARGWA